MPEKDGVIVGDDTPENHREEVSAEEQVPATEQSQPEQSAEKVYANKYKSLADLEKGYSDLEVKLGEQGSRLGQAEQEKSVLLNQLEQMQAQTAPAQRQTPEEEDLNAKLEALSKAVEEGDLSIADGMMQTAQITSQIAQQNTLQSISQQQQEQALNGSKSKFAEDNADFFDMQQSGALEDVKAQYPGFHDDVSAYYAKQAMDSNASLEAAVEAARNEGFEAGKAEMAKVADGDNNTRKVLQKPGETAKDIGGKPPGAFSRNELQQSGLAALQGARGG